MAGESVLIGIDVGGTYTDCVLLSGEGLKVLKVPSTPETPSTGALRGIRRLIREKDFEVIHGSTVGTNAILERKGSRTALIVTKGFKDLMQIGRQTRKELYGLTPEGQRPLVERSNLFEIDERIDYNGAVLKAAKPEEIKAIFDALSRKKVESVAVCLLFSFVNDIHERLITLRGDSMNVSLSSDVLCEFREYERCSTTILNAYIAPLMKNYFDELAASLASLGARSLWIMQSNGGIFPVENACRKPVHTILSGPAAGVRGAYALARQAGFSGVITIDMGGTSTDVSLCEDSLPVTNEGSIDGHPVRIPILDITTIGAGGGSIAYIDEGGALKVGPESAGADPGPVCFGKGRRITVTDAHLILGRLPDRDFLDGARFLDVKRTREHFSSFTATMGSNIEEAAWGIIQVVQAQMEGALRLVSLQRGHDPRRFTLLAFGGAGPLHACELASALNIPKVLIPLYPGVLSALGMITAPHFMEFSKTMKMELLRLTPEKMKHIFGILRERAAREIGVDERLLECEYYVDMRYAGQSYDLTVPVTVFDTGSIAASFISIHHRRHGYERSDSEIEVVTFRLRAGQAREEPVFSREWAPGKSSSASHRKVWWAQGREPLREYDFLLLKRESLVPGASIKAPAIVLQYDCTTIIPPGWEGVIDTQGNMILENLAMTASLNKKIPGEPIQ